MIRTCSACGQKNRISVEHLADTGRCGACKTALPPLAAPLDADARDFDQIVERARVPVLVDFWAAWCGPCRMAAPEVARVARDVAGRGLVVKVDTERHPELAQRYRISAIPTFLVFSGGNVVHQHAGLARAPEMASWLAQETVRT